MYILDYLIYQLRPFGIQIDQRPSVPEAPPDFNLTATPWFASNVTSNETTSKKNEQQKTLIKCMLIVIQ
jgi:glycoprotein-N-acetylgalactosamine 3-beta-galactosyltransferase